MELDDLKNTWDDISRQVNNQQKLNAKSIEQMTKKKFYPGMKKIAYPEIIGTLICIAAAVFVVANFSKLDTGFLQGTGIVSIFILLILATLSLMSLRQLTLNTDPTRSYAETLKDFAVQKIKFHKLQRINVTLSYLLLVTTIILISKFFHGNDITNSKYFWTFSFTIGYIFLLFYSKWVSKFYNKTLRQAEDLLKELAS